MRKTLILILIVIVTIASTYALVHYISMQGFAFAWALNFMLMGCVLTFTETLKGQLTSRYYNEQPWEQGGKIYQSLGINFFRKRTRCVRKDRAQTHHIPFELRNL